MKRALLLSAIIATLGNQAIAQQNDRDFSSLDTALVLQKLFDATTIEATKIAVWKPNYSESIRLRAPANNFTYTTIDTIIRFKVKTDLAVIVFNTYASKELASCNTCPRVLSIALFEKKPEAKWRLIDFSKIATKYRLEGKIHHYRMIKLSNLDIYALAFDLDNGDRDSPVYYRELHLYNVYNPENNEISPALNTILIYSNKENANNNLHYSYTSDIKFIPGPLWHGIEISSRGTSPDFNGKIGPYNMKKRYFFNQAFMAYDSK